MIFVFYFTFVSNQTPFLFFLQEFKFTSFNYCVLCYFTVHWSVEFATSNCAKRVLVLSFHLPLNVLLQLRWTNFLFTTSRLFLQWWPLTRTGMSGILILQHLYLLKSGWTFRCQRSLFKVSLATFCTWTSYGSMWNANSLDWGSKEYFTHAT